MKPSLTPTSQLFLNTLDATSPEKGDYTWLIDVNCLLGQNAGYLRKYNLILQRVTYFMPTQITNTHRYPSIVVTSDCLQFRSSRFVGKQCRNLQSFEIAFLSLPESTSWSGSGPTKNSASLAATYRYGNSNTFTLHKPQGYLRIQLQSLQDSFPKLPPPSIVPDTLTFCFTIQEIVDVPRVIPFTPRTNRVHFSQGDADSGTTTDFTFLNIDLKAIINDYEIGAKYNLLTRCIMAAEEANNYHVFDINLECSAMKFQTYRAHRGNVNLAFVGIRNYPLLTTPEVSHFSTLFANTFTLTDRFANVRLFMSQASTTNTLAPPGSNIILGETTIVFEIHRLP